MGRWFDRSDGLLPLLLEKTGMIMPNGAMGAAMRYLAAWVSGPGKISGLEKRLDVHEAKEEARYKEAAQFHVGISRALGRVEGALGIKTPEEDI